MRRWLSLFCLCIPVMAFAQTADPASVQRGEYLAKLGDCTACHSAPGKPTYAGGLPMQSPFGTIWTTNITPDPETGIGNYNLKEFTRVMRDGVAKYGHLYPAMPYPSLAILTDQDIADLYAYFEHGVRPAHYKPPTTAPTFPFNQRWGLAMWDMVFARQGVFTPDTTKDAAWNRGAYIVRGLGHCGSCHTPRNVAYAEKAYSESSPDYLSGAYTDKWFSANLTEDRASGLGRWSEADIAAFLKTGHGGGAASFGNMTQAVEDSTQYMTDDDRNAIAHYLKSLQAPRETAEYKPGTARAPMSEHPGAGLYQSACAGCHSADGTGKLPRIPALAGNPIVMSPKPDSLILLVLNGDTGANTQTGPSQVHMPGFDRWTNQEIADAISYIRTSWGNDASAVAASAVQALREAAKEKRETGN